MDAGQPPLVAFAHKDEGGPELTVVGLTAIRRAIRGILINPRYTGRQVWNRQRKDEVLIDIDDVALGHETKQRWNSKDQWIWSATAVHDALVTTEEFQQAQELFDAKGRRDQPVVTTKRTRHPYQLRGILFCGLCHRRMQGSWNNGKPHYRCVYPIEYALANQTEHPRSVYLREEMLVPPLDRWLHTGLLPSRLPDSLRAMAESQVDHHDAEHEARAADARRIIADCDRRLARYRAALDAGTDPQLIARWTAEVNATRAAAQARLRPAASSARMTADEIARLVEGLGSTLTVLRDADPLDKADLYSRNRPTPDLPAWPT